MLWPRVCPAWEDALAGIDKDGEELGKETGRYITEVFWLEESFEGYQVQLLTQHLHKVPSGSIEGTSKPEITSTETCGDTFLPQLTQDADAASSAAQMPQGAVALVAKLSLFPAVLR